MTNLDLANNLILGTDFDTNKNLSSIVYTFNYPSGSLPVSGWSSQTFTFPSNFADELYQLYIEYSFASGVWRNMPAPAVISGNVGISAYINNDGVNVSLYVFVANQTGGTITSPAFTINLSVRNFVPPF